LEPGEAGSVEYVVSAQEPPKKDKRKKGKDAVALTTAEYTNGSAETTPSKRKVTLQQLRSR
jgi:hypothetical protein